MAPKSPMKIMQTPGSANLAFFQGLAHQETPHTDVLMP